jgi:DNA ligase-1
MDGMASTLEAVGSTASRNRKVRRLAEWLRSLDDEDLDRALYLLAGEKSLSVGYSTLREAAERATGWDRDMIRLCHREVGDSGEAIALLLRGKTREEELSLTEAEAIFAAIGKAKKTAEKVELLVAAWMRMKPATVKYFVKVITGNFRVGLQVKLVEEALALACGVEVGEVRAAQNRAGDLAAVARAARRGELAAVEARLFHPLEFMLARPLEDFGELPEGEFYVEDKFDGIRSQLHFDGGKVKIFTRGMEEATAAFPELVEAFLARSGSAVIDGEVLAWRDGKALNFTMLQQRIARKKVTAELRAEIPVVFVGYDLLYRDGRLLVDETIERRREGLETLLAEAGERVLVSRQERLASREEIEERFVAARARGNEGLLLKRAGSLYEGGKRSANWVKVKRPYATLDVVVTAAEQGSGRRATLLSDYTFAVRDGERFLNIGKAYSGLTDEEIRALTRLFRSIATEKFGRVTLVRPEVVLEVAFDGIQKSPRHRSGFALRFPRIVRWRQDKKVEEIDTLERVRAIYASTLG